MKNISLSIIAVLLISGCATVPMATLEESKSTKNFSPPPANKSGIYIYRSGVFGAALKKDIWIGGKCIGESASNTFFYETVNGNQEHKISTESEFSPNNLVVKTESGKNYFVRQYIKMGLFVGGAGLELVDKTKGREAVRKLKLAKKGVCSK